MKPQSSSSSYRAPRRGSVLLFTLFMLVIAAVAVTGVVAMVWGHMRGSERAEARLRAFYAAEAGVQQVVDWFNRGYFTWFQSVYGTQTQYHGVTFHTWDGSLFTDSNFQVLFRPFTESPNRGLFIDSGGTSSFLYGGTADRIVISKRSQSPTPSHLGTAAALQSSTWVRYIPALTDRTSGRSAGLVEELRILRPTPGSGKICHVVSVGKDPATGMVSTVEADLTGPWIPEILAPAALISKGLASSSGLFEVHWGEVWSHGNLDIVNPIWQKYPKDSEDPWFKGRSEGMIVGKDILDNTWYADGSIEGGWRSDPVPDSSPNYLQPFRELDPRNQAHLGGFQNSFWQHQTITWPDYEYRMVKAYCLRHGYPVYKTTADGNLIVDTDPATGLPITKTFEELFNLSGTLDPDEIDREVLPPIYFIDTTDGLPPRTDPDGTSNMATIQVTGSGPFFYGLFFMASNVYFGGAGNSPSYDNPEMPDLSIARTNIRNCRVMGLLYSYGTGEFQGQGDVYGALFARNGFNGGGIWSLYYDWRLADPLRNRTGSRVTQAIWKTYHGYPQN